MCGIAGTYAYATGAPADPDILRAMTGRLAHRGPDGEGHAIEGPLGLGHRRLAVIDPSTSGLQPLANEDGNILIVCNGEFYGYRDWIPWLEARGHRFRSASDTEVIVHLYEEFGIDVLERIDGMFAFALWDRSKRRLLLARDRIGIKPLYYHLTGERVVFASEMKALLADPGIPRRVDPAAMAAFLHVLTIPEPHAIFADIRKLPAGHALVVEPAGARLFPYWDIEDVTSEPGSGDPGAAFPGLLEEAVRSHLVADVPVGAFLSGGLDSSAVVAAATRAAPPAAEPLHTFSIAFPGDPVHDEAEVAEAVARHCGTRHTAIPFSPDMVRTLPLMVWHADEPFAVASALGVFELAKAARQSVTVVLSGDGADEILAGYPWRHDPEAPLQGPTPAHAYLSTVTTLGRTALAALSTPDFLNSITGSLWLPAFEEGFARFPQSDAVTRRLYTDIKTTLVSEMLTKLDRMTMAHGLEARVPFLDYRLVAWAFRLPTAARIAGGVGKKPLRRAVSAWLPEGLADRPKHGFNMPMAAWWRGPLREFVRDHLTPGRVAARGLFQPMAVTRLLDEHERGERDAATTIFTLLCAELWSTLYMDGRGERP